MSQVVIGILVFLVIVAYGVLGQPLLKKQPIDWSLAKYFGIGIVAAAIVYIVLNAITG